MRDPIFVDTGAWYALLDRKDPDHVKVSACMLENEGRLLTSNFVLDETITLLRYRLGHKVTSVFGEKVLNQNVCKYVKVTTSDETRGWEIFKKFKDKRFSFTDCTSFGLIERLKINTAVALDKDFRSFGIHCIPS